jgi:hypothetical protein
LIKTQLLYALGEFTTQAVSGIRLPARRQKEDQSEPEPRAAGVYLTHLPDGKTATQKAPYILHQILNGKDRQTSGQAMDSTATVRSILCVYDRDEQRGGLNLLNLMEQLRVELLRQRVLERRYVLDLEDGVETLVYPQDMAPYFAGEMITTWKMPPIQREALPPMLGGLPPRDPGKQTEGE